MVMLPPLGTPGTYFDTGSSRLSLFSCASYMINAAVIVLVLEAILKWVTARGGLFAPSNVGAVGDRRLPLVCAGE
jgi:hypothetical protein